MEFFLFDIETCGSYKDFSDFSLNDKKGSELFRSKYGKIDWEFKYGSIENAYLEVSPIMSTYGKICCISFGYLDNGQKRIKSFYGEDEEKIVTSFNDLLKKIEIKNFTLSGYRILYFDIPWILHKLHKYNIKPANIIYLYNKKPWDCRIVDLSDDFKQKFAWTYSFDEACYELNIKSPKDKMNGSEVHQYYWNGKYEEIKEYCEKDVSASIDLSIKMYE